MDYILNYHFFFDPSNHYTWLNKVIFFLIMGISFYLFHLYTKKIIFKEYQNLQQITEKIMYERTKRLTQTTDQLQWEIKQHSDTNEELNLFRYMVNQSNDAIFISDAQTGQIIHVNEQACMSLGYTLDELLKSSVTEIEELFTTLEKWHEHVDEVRKKNHLVLEGHHRKKDGNIFPIEISVKLVKYKRKEYIVAIARDISIRKQKEEQQKLTQAIFENTAEGIIITNNMKEITWANPAFTKLTGYSLDEVLNKNPSILKSGRHDKEFYMDLWYNIDTKGYWQGEIWNRRKNGEIFPEWLTISVIRDEMGKPHQYVAVFSDITKLKEHENLIKYKAYHDALTELPNRHLFYDRLDVALLNAKDSNNQLAVMFLDLDGFKQINDQFGHDIGDKLLQIIAERIKNAIRKGDTVARIGGDEFTILLPTISQNHDAEKVAQKILKSITNPIMIESNQIKISASIGISIHPIHGDDSSILLKRADEAMYTAKDLGKNQFQYYNQEISR